MKKFVWLLIWSFALIATGCSEEPDPDSGKAIEPNKEVPDPTGTIELSMRNNDDTSLNGLYIGKDDNFHGYGWMIASIGKVKGLGNVASIPSSGWASRVAVTPGHGYVAYNTSSEDFYRIFVSDYIQSASTGGIIGADIKYQKPFRGLDESISLKQANVVFSAEGGSEQLVFNNTSIIPFKITSSENWCHVHKASTCDENFLYDAIVISCDESFSANETKATVTIETIFGKTKEIKVTRAARGEFISLSQQEFNLGFLTSDSQHSISIFTNVDPKDISLICSDDWLSGYFSGNIYAPERKIRWIEGKQPSRSSIENPISKEFVITVKGYAGSEAREGTITFQHGTTTSILKITQMGSSFRLAQNSFDFEAEDNLTQTTDFTGDLNYQELVVTSDENADWITIQFDYNKMILRAHPNPYEDIRTATIKIGYAGNSIADPLIISEVHVSQRGSIPYDRYIYFQSPASNYTISFPLVEGAKISSSAEWCTATPSSTSTLVVRATATETDRWAEISIDGISSKIYVSQSKYKVGDTYTEGAIIGSICKMENGVGFIFQERTYNCSYPWSIENVYITNATDQYDGRKNTEAIKAIPGWKELYPAFAVVELLNVNGANGWYLPACKEFASVDRYYWSSTQVDNTRAYYCNNLNSYVGNKSGGHDVVAMNSFSYNFIP